MPVGHVTVQTAHCQELYKPRFMCVFVANSIDNNYPRTRMSRVPSAHCCKIFTAASRSGTDGGGRHCWSHMKCANHL